MELFVRVQSTTRITDFFVVGKMSGILVGFVILVGHFLDREALKECVVWVVKQDFLDRSKKVKDEKNSNLKIVTQNSIKNSRSQQMSDFFIKTQ